MKKITSILLVLIMILTTGCRGIKLEEISNYLTESNTTINLQDTSDFTGLEPLIKKIKEKRIILAGGSKGLTKDEILNIKLIKYLQKEIGLNYYLAEIGYSEAYFLNEYLSSGDENKLKDAFYKIDSSDEYNQDNYNFYKELYEFNATLNDEDKIEIVGINLETNLRSTHEYIKSIIKNKDLKIGEIEELLEIIEEVELYLQEWTIENEDIDYEKKLFENLNSKTDILIENINKNKDLYMSVLKENIFGFEIVLNSLKVYSLKTFTSENEYLKKREERVYQNFLVQDYKLDNAIYFGQFNSLSINKMPLNNYGNLETVAYKMDKSNKYKGKVMSILYSYNGDLYGGPIEIGMFNKYLKSVDDCILFDLTNTNSPFKKEFISLCEKERMYDKSKLMTDYIDFMIMIKGSFESHQLKL